MPLNESHSELFSTAFVIGKRVETYWGGLRSFWRENPSVEREVLREIWNRVFDRAQRVKYIEQSNPGWYINRDKIGCPETGNTIFMSFAITFVDEDGQQHEQIFHGISPLMQRIGKNIDEVMHDITRQLRDRYFRGWSLMQTGKRITNAELRQVKCLTGRG